MAWSLAGQGWSREQAHKMAKEWHAKGWKTRIKKSRFHSGVNVEVETDASNRHKVVIGAPQQKD